MRREHGFTLIEILAVIAILGLLMSLAIWNFGKQRTKGEVAATKARIVELAGMIQKYETSHGGPPFDRLSRLKPPVQSSGNLNEGAESLFASLQNKDFPEGALIEESWLGNSDDDTTSTPFHRVAGFKNDLFEVKDVWDNPIAYFHYSNYSQPQTYRMVNSPNPDDPDQVVTARQSAKTGTYEHPDSYQLISAGPDHEFGTEDDITND